MAKDFGNVDVDALSNYAAASLPHRRQAAPRREPREPREAPPPKRKTRQERIEQVNVSMRAGLRKGLIKLALDADMTVRAFVLDALKSKGLAVRDDDLTDMRKRP